MLSGRVPHWGYAAAIASLPGLSRAQGVTAADTTGSVLQMFGGLAVVLALLIGGLYLLKKIQTRQGAAGLLRVIGATAVGARERVVLVEIAGTWLVVGVAPGHVNLLHSLPKQTVPENADSTTPDFAMRLRQLLGKNENAL